MVVAKKDETVITAMVDYLTVSTKSAGESGTLIHELYKCLGQRFLAEERKRVWGFAGFHGAQFQGVRYGLRGDEALVMLSGARAGELWREIAPLRQNCTRVDLAVTCYLSGVKETVAIDAYKGSLDNGSVQCSHVVNSRGGSTAYVGSRASQYFGRLYDKGAEQGGDKGKIWRYEVEVKKPKSEAHISQLLVSQNPASYITSFVHSFFACRGVVPLFHSTNTECAIEIESNVSSAEKTLLWLSSQVQPTIGRLIVAGFEEEVREALGLPKGQISYFDDDKEIK